MPNSKDLIVFDLDGVILDSRANMERAWKQVRTIEVHCLHMGTTASDLMRVLALPVKQYRQNRPDRPPIKRHLLFVQQVLQSFQPFRLG